jgi:hypothetical protein
MAHAAVAQHDRLDQRRPAKIVDMIERRAGVDQRSHDFDVAEVRRRNQGCALRRTAYVVGPASPVERDLEHRHVVGNRSNGDDVVLLGLECVGIGTEAQQGNSGVLLAHEDGDVKRRAGAAVARIDHPAGRHQAFDFAGIASGRRGVQAAIGRYFGRARRNLRRRWCHQSEKDNQTQRASVNIES